MMRIHFALWFYLLKCSLGALSPECAEVCSCCKNDSFCNAEDSNNVCVGSCVDTVWGHRCHHRCMNNCQVCSQAHGDICYVCKDTFYDKVAHCNKSCSVGCVGGNCHDDGSCICLDNFEGVKCDNCTIGKYGENCTNVCITPNCRCSEQYKCESCKVGHYGSICEHECSTGCLNDGCLKNSGDCNNGCILNHYGSRCENECPQTCKPSDLSLRCNGTGKCLNGCIDGYSGNKCDSYTTELLSQSGPAQGLTTGVGVGGFLAGVIVAIVVVVILLRRRTAGENATERQNPSINLSTIEVQDDSRVVGIYATPVEGDQAEHKYDPLRFPSNGQSKDNDMNDIKYVHVYNNQ
ncbi:multiple epidermal growth factor-like domains protein 11 isoform X2 [Mya arenaria]|nr:multiple epidermal growth factor-like domains protein 11 isoform X2 [Mya arenaria]XP_052811684.1 multiple epidermal growth factor-like domains protein 11 isoform X2 [Mya arenaria]